MLESSSFNRIGVPALGDHTSILTVVPADQSIAPFKLNEAPAQTSAPAFLVIAVTFADELPLVSGLAITSAGSTPPNTPQV